MLSVVFWIVLGALVGWIAFILQDHNEPAPRRTSTFIAIGITGGVVGGITGMLLDSNDTVYQASTTDIMFAVFGASFFVVLAGLLTARHS